MSFQSKACQCYLYCDKTPVYIFKWLWKLVGAVQLTAPRFLLEMSIDWDRDGIVLKRAYAFLLFVLPTYGIDV